MTNYNERLDEILWSAIMHEPAPTKPGEEYKATWNEPVIKKAKQALLALIKEENIKYLEWAKTASVWNIENRITELKALKKLL